MDFIDLQWFKGNGTKMKIKKRKLIAIMFVLVALLTLAMVIPAVLSVKASGSGSYSITENNTQSTETEENITLFAGGSIYTSMEIAYGTVLVQYIDQNANQLAEDIVLKGKTGAEYTAVAKEIEGYICVEVKGWTTGKYTAEQQVVQYVYEKIEVEIVRTAYIKKPGTWNNEMYCYVYSGDDDTIKNAEWPGVKMTYVANGVYKYEVPSEISNPLVLFTDGKNQYPGVMKRGLELPGDMVYLSGDWKPFTTSVLTSVNVVYFERESSWGEEIYCYAYSSEDGAINAEWPGVKMTHVAGNIYKYQVPSGVTSPLVIFSDSKQQYPGSMQPGLPLSGSMIYQDGLWKNYN